MISSLVSWLRKQRHIQRQKNVEKSCRDMVHSLQKIFKNRPSDEIPVFVVSYNNGVYVAHTVEQLSRYGIKPIIYDNHSTDANTIEILANIESQADIIRSPQNFGHMVGFLPPLYQHLPELFAYTDPDLRFHPSLPANFLQQFAQLTIDYRVFKVGCALTLDLPSALSEKTFNTGSVLPIAHARTWKIKEYESRYWTKRLRHEHLELYAAPIDTTFAVYRKSNFCGDFLDAIRVAGNFSAIHLPWFPELDLFSETAREAYRKGNIASSWI